MGMFVMMSKDQLGLEEESDATLRSKNSESEYPYTTECNLSRRGLVRVSLNSILEWRVAPSQNYCDELKFLISVSNLPRFLRPCLRLWAEGYSQSEIALITQTPQQTISNRLRKGLQICYDNTPVSFRRFSEHTIYRSPSHAPISSHRANCVRCGTTFVISIGIGRYCSVECKQVSMQRARRRKRIAG